MKVDLGALADQVMKQKGLETEFSKEAIEQLQSIHSPAKPLGAPCEDLRSLLFSSIDNSNSRDLDQLTYAQKNSDGTRTLWIAVADAEALIGKNTPIDTHAQINSTSVYTPAKIFPLLPEKLSFDWTSLNEQEDRLAICVKIQIDSSLQMQNVSIFQAMVKNYAKLTYHHLGEWLAGRALLPEKVGKIAGLEKALLFQHETAQLMQQKRHLLGSLTLHPIEIEARFTEDLHIYFEPPPHNYAHQLIESFMIAANIAIARQLRKANTPSLRRVVRTPKRWERIVAIARSFGTLLPQNPDPKALDDFLLLRKTKDFESFQDLSLIMIKLLGRGEYVVEMPNAPPLGHFNLGISEYTHSTAPNRRFADLMSIRQCKALILGKANPYSLDELNFLARHCTQKEEAALKVERHLNKSAAALYLASSIGKKFDAIITGSSNKGTWARISSPPVEGRVVQGYEGVDVGDRVQIVLESVDIAKGFINFII